MKLRCPERVFQVGLEPWFLLHSLMMSRKGVFHDALEPKLCLQPFMIPVSSEALMSRKSLPWCSRARTPPLASEVQMSRKRDPHDFYKRRTLFSAFDVQMSRKRDLHDVLEPVLHLYYLMPRNPEENSMMLQNPGSSTSLWRCPIIQKEVPSLCSRTKTVLLFFEAQKSRKRVLFNILGLES